MKPSHALFHICEHSHENKLPISHKQDLSQAEFKLHIQYHTSVIVYAKLINTTCINIRWVMMLIKLCNMQVNCTYLLKILAQNFLSQYFQEVCTIDLHVA